MDSHGVQRVLADGKVRSEGHFSEPIPAPYPISYRAIVPKRGECENLLVPICVSASHAAYGSIRMEPVFISLDEASATAAVLALDRKISVQDVPYWCLKCLAVA